MSAQKHTPGPWRTGKAPHGDCRVYSDSHEHAIARTYGPDLNGLGVCQLTGPTNKADAMLIAAAPELLVALRMLLLAFDEQGTVIRRGVRYHNAAARSLSIAAIKKATGAQA